MCYTRTVLHCVSCMIRLYLCVLHPVLYSHCVLLPLCYLYQIYPCVLLNSSCLSLHSVFYCRVFSTHVCLCEEWQSSVCKVCCVIRLWWWTAMSTLRLVTGRRRRGERSGGIKHFWKMNRHFVFLSSEWFTPQYPVFIFILTQHNATASQQWLWL